MADSKKSYLINTLLYQTELFQGDTPKTGFEPVTHGLQANFVFVSNLLSREGENRTPKHLFPRILNCCTNLHTSLWQRRLDSNQRLTVLVTIDFTHLSTPPRIRCKPAFLIHRHLYITFYLFNLKLIFWCINPLYYFPL